MAQPGPARATHERRRFSRFAPTASHRCRLQFRAAAADGRLGCVSVGGIALHGCDVPAQAGDTVAVELDGVAAAGRVAWGRGGTIGLHIPDLYEPPAVFQAVMHRELDCAASCIRTDGRE